MIHTRKAALSPQSGYRFSARSCSIKNLERDGTSTHCSSARLRRDQSLDAAGADGAGEICVGAAAGAGCDSLSGGFLAAATAGLWAGFGLGRDAGALALLAGGEVGRPAAGPGVPVPGSGIMMLTGGVEVADGNSALVGLPVGTDGGNAASAPMASAFA